MHCIVPELYVNVRRAVEYRFLHLVWFARAATSSAERVVNRDFVRGRNIFVDHLLLVALHALFLENTNSRTSSVNSDHGAPASSERTSS